MHARTASHVSSTTGPETPVRRLRENAINWLALIVLLALGIVWPPAQAQDFTDTRSGRLLLKASADAEPVEALRVATTMHATVTGTVARVRVRQEFSNPTEDWVEGLYVFPLSDGAAVDELMMRIGERRIRGEIQRRDEARAIYEKARSEGRRASLVDQERPNMFTTSVANIAPRSSIVVEIAYLDIVPYKDGRYTLHLPLAITPRYTPGAFETGWFGATPEKTTPAEQRVSIEVELRSGFPLASVRSLHHAVAVRDTSGGKRIVLQANQVPANRDFELTWTPVITQDTHAAAFVETAGDDAYVLITLTPPDVATASATPREILFIIDTSGSMHGPSIEQARAALLIGIERLTERDRFNIIRFSDSASSLFATPQPVNASSRALARRYISTLTADGGTEMQAALELAFATLPDPEMLRQIVFITDGSVSNEVQLAAMIRNRIGRARLFTVGIGAAPNAHFMREAAAAGRGSYTFIPRINQVRERMEDLFRKLEQPALVDLELQWPALENAELAATLPGDVYAGDPIIIAARLNRIPTGMLTLSGRSQGQHWVRQLPLQVLDGQSGVAKLWARERIRELTRQRHFSTDPDAINEQIVQLALEHHLVSDLTSLVAVDVTPARPAGIADRFMQAPTAAPAGSYWARTTGFAGTATPASLLLLIGLCALLAAAWIFRAGVSQRVRAGE